jgi:predicted nucleic acid-binding protein
VILVDTSAWVALLRKRNDPAVFLLRRLLVEGRTCIAPVIVQELLQGARGPAELARLRARFLALPLLSATPVTHAEAGALYARCRWRGITVRSPHDCLIASLAIEHATPLLAMDRDFEVIATVEPRLVLETPTHS